MRSSNLVLVLALAVVVLAPGAVAAEGPSPDATGDDGGVGPLATWCSLYEGDGGSSPATEGWTVRPFGATSITGSSSGGSTVAIVSDADTSNGAWMQRFMDLQPPFNLSVRGRYDPATARTGRVGLAYGFTGTHAFRASLYPSSIRIDGIAPVLTLPATQGTWYNITFDAKAILDVDVYVDGVLVGNGEMQPTDRIIFDEPNNKAVIAALETRTDETSLAMVDYIRTTMCPPTDVPPKTPDRTAPVTRNAALDDGVQPPANDLTVRIGDVAQVWLNATVDDTASGGSTIWSANATLGTRAWPGTPMAPTDGAFDEILEGVGASIDLTAFTPGVYQYCAYGRDYYGNKDLTGSCATLRLVPRPPGDTTPPRIVVTIPIPDSTGVRVDTDVRVYFSEAMDAGATAGAFSLSGPDGAVTGTVSWLDSGSTLVFLSSTDLRRNGTYTATVGASARDVAGNLLSQPAMWSFRVEPEPAPTSTATQNWKPVIALLFAVLLEIAAIPMAMRMSRRPGAPWTRPLLSASVFAAGELATGVVSMGVPALAVPPLIGAGLVLDVVIFAAGMVLVLLLGLAKGKAVPPP